jgi:hypothetical protein
MRLRLTSALALAALAASLTLNGCAAPPAVHDQASFGLPGSRLVIDVDSSSLRLVPGTGPVIRAQRWLSGTPAQPGHSFWGLTGDTLRLSVDCSGLVFHCGSRFQVAVPPGVSVLVHSGNGEDTVSGLPGPVVIDGGSGQVVLTDVSGPLQVTTGSGSISASGLRSPTVQAASNQGSVDVSFAAAPRLAGVRSATGNVTVQVPAAGQQYHVMVASGTGTASSRVPDNRLSSNVVQASSVHGSATVLPAR